MRISVLVMAASMLLTTTAMAATVIAESKTIESDPVKPTLSYFDVYIDNDGTDPDVFAFQGRVLQASGNPAGLSFGTPTRTDATLPVRTPLVDVVSNQFFFQSPFGILTNSVSEVSMASGALIPAPVIDGAGLFRVPVTIDAGVIGTFDIELVDDPNTGFLLSDGFAQPIPQTLINGQLTVVPEPGSLTLLGLAAISLIRRRTSRA